MHNQPTQNQVPHNQVLDDITKLSEYVVCGATTRCTLGTMLSTLAMPLSHGVFLKEQPQCNIGDRIPIKNIRIFGNCKRTLPPPPCTPVVPLPWVNQKNTTLSINNQKALIDDAVCFCTFGGVISLVDSGQK